MDKRQNPHQFFAYQERDTDRRFDPCPVNGIVRTDQPAFVFARVKNQRVFAIINDPSSQSTLHCVAQLLRSMLMDLLPIDDRCINCFASVIQYDNAATFTTYILHGCIQDTLEHGAEVERSGYLAADMKKELQ